MSLLGFPDGPLVKTPCFHCKGHRFDTGSGIKYLTCHIVQQRKRQPVKQNVFVWCLIDSADEECLLKPSNHIVLIEQEEDSTSCVTDYI